MRHGFCLSSRDGGSRRRTTDVTSLLRSCSRTRGETWGVPTGRRTVVWCLQGASRPRSRLEPWHHTIPVRISFARLRERHTEAPSCSLVKWFTVDRCVLTCSSVLARAISVLPYSVWTFDCARSAHYILFWNISIIPLAKCISLNNSIPYCVSKVCVPKELLLKSSQSFRWVKTTEFRYFELRSRIAQVLLLCPLT